jgi:hypothetical protein
MKILVDFPILLFIVSFAVLWLCAWLGASFLGEYVPQSAQATAAFSLLLTATLTLLGLIIAFSFSMAIGRYDQRKTYEEAEANAIGTEYLRADLLPAAVVPQARALLRQYADQRILFYTTRNAHKLGEINAKTSQLQAEMWELVSRAALQAPPSPVSALAVWGMNDVLNSQGYSQAAWWNRIPLGAWTLLILIALLSNVLLGYATRHLKTRLVLLMVLPFAVSSAFLLIADIDSPRGGIIRVAPQNLLSLAESLR